MGMYQSQTCKQFLTTSGDVKTLCKDCKWMALCRGGCRCDRENTISGDIERNYYCEAFYGFFDDALPKMVEVAKYVAKQTAPGM